MSWKDYTYYYFLGVGGIGMSALARYLHHLDKKVLGYDKTETPLTKSLVSEGIGVHYEDDISQIPPDVNRKNTLVIITPAIPKELKEYTHFANSEFEIIKRAKLLGLVSSETRNLSVAGTHGKTTTSAFLAHILESVKLPAVSFLGGITEDYASNFIFRGNEFSVTEADEFDRSFLNLQPELISITSTDADHLDVFGTEEEIKKTFQTFADKASKKVFAYSETSIENATTYGFDSTADVVISKPRIKLGYFIFDIKTSKFQIQNLEIKLPGNHNVLNATAAVLMALEIGVESEQIKDSLKSFSGIKRRFSQYKSPSGKIYIDDYAHHPSELIAAISTAKALYPNKKILGVFQPHLYSRTRDFMQGFADSLSSLDELILLPIYPARELPIAGVSSNELLEKVSLDRKRLQDFDKVLDEINELSFDVVMTMGAGNIDQLYEPIKEILK